MDKKVPVVRFKGFTDDWEQRKLTDVASKFMYGLNVASKYYDGTNKYLRITDIDDLSHNLSNKKLTSPDSKDIDESYLLKQNDLLFARTGASVGKTYLYKSSDGIVYFAGYLIKASILDNFDSKFIFNITLTTKYNNFVKVTSQRSGQPRINAKEYSNYKFKMPNSLKEQKSIGYLLNLIDDLVALYQEQLHFYEKLKKTLLQNMFANTHRSKPVIRFSKFHDSWEPRELNAVMSDFIVPMRDKPKQFGGTIPWTRIDDIDGKYLNESKSGNYVSTETIKSMNLKVIPKNSLIVSASATFGVVAIVTNDLVTNQTFIGLVPKPSYNLEFLFNLFKTPRIQKLMRIESVGSTIFYISRDKFKKMNCNVPTLKEQNLIGKICRSVDEFIALYQTKLNYMNSEKEYLLQKLFI